MGSYKGTKKNDSVTGVEHEVNEFKEFGIGADAVANMPTWRRLDETRDLATIVALLHDEVTLSMPPIPFWVSGRDQVARFFAHRLGKLLGRFQRHRHAVSAGAQPIHQRIAIGAFDGVLAGRIDIGDDDRVGIVETGAEFLEQAVEPGIPVRLNDGDNPSPADRTRRRQRRSRVACRSREEPYG